MIVLSNITDQTIAVGQSITFDTVLLHTGCGECHRKNTQSVKLRANGVYDISFNANISAATATTEVELTIELGGSALPETRMVATVVAANDLHHVSTRTLVRNCCGDFDRITVTNTGGATVALDPNSALVIKRVS